MVVRNQTACFSIRKLLGLNNRVERRNGMEKLTKIFAALIVSAIVGSFVALVIAHILALNHGEYYKAIGSQETIFIATLTLGLMIVLIIPYTINKEQVKRNIEQEIENYWKNNYQKNMKQFISKSEGDYAHISRMIAYLLKQKKHYYWAMAWAGESVVAYIVRFKEHSDDFQINEEYFKFSLKIMKISFYMREQGTFLEDNIDLEPDDNFKKKFKISYFEPDEEPFELNEKLINEIKNKIYKGIRITLREKEVNAVKELKRVILRYIKWQCIIYIEMQRHKPKNVIDLIKKYLDSTFKEHFEEMVKNILKSFYDVDENVYNIDKKQFINDIVEKVVLEEYHEKVREYLEKMLNTPHT
jgi:phosphate/sulfate permease